MYHPWKILARPSSVFHESPIIWYSASISALFLLSLPIRVWQLRRASEKLLPNLLGRIKALLSIAFLSLQLWPLILDVQYTFHASNSSTLFYILAAAAAAGACWVSFTEHRRTIRPSSLLILYLLAYLVGELIQLTLPASVSGDVRKYPLASVRVLVGFAFLVAENVDKKSILREPYQFATLEETAGILGKAFFWWINPILKDGNRSILAAEELPPIDGKLSGSGLRRGIVEAWNKRRNPDGKTQLPSVLLRYIARPLLAAILPRLTVIIFRYSQVVLINVSIRYISQDTMAGIDTGTGYWIVVSAIVVYTGMALSTAVYQHQLNRLKVIVRGALIGLIHHRSMELGPGVHDDAKAVTLMSTDVNNLESIGQMLHEIWAQLLEVVVGTTMLASQISWFCLVPYLIIIVCSRVSRYVAINMKSRQRNWSIATQNRISMIASMLGATKSMKMLGMTEAMKYKIEQLRNEEIETSKHARWVMVIYNASANALGLFAPVITLSLFAIVSKVRGDGSLDTGTAFTSIALLTMVTHPANMVMTFVPEIVASLANFERVQNYLLETPFDDCRLDIKHFEVRPRSLLDDDIQTSASGLAVVVDNVTIKHSPGLKPLLHDISFNIKAGSVMMCSGMVGSGKTSLAQLILGETSPSIGTVHVSTRRIGLCKQVAWLPSGTIREIICGVSANADFDAPWYDTVLHACDLLPDLKTLPQYDETQVGSRGLNISGGQRQRVALARALYARCDILVLDDAFNALDRKTESNVIQRLLGPDGILKKMRTTVFMITHAAQYFPLADEIIILGGSTIKTRGTWDQLKNAPGDVVKIALDGTSTHTNTDDQTTSKPQNQVINDAADDLTRQTGDIALYSYYFRTVGIANILLLVSLSISYSFTITFSTYWLKWWTGAPASDEWFYVGGYILFSMIAWGATSVSMWTMYIRIASRSGLLLHRRLLDAIVGAPLSYYSVNDNSIILNRFGQDIQMIDSNLPAVLGPILAQIFKLLVQGILLFTIQNALILTLPFCIIIIYIVQRIYLRTSRQLRFIELESRSALYSSFLETVEGVETIRAFGWQRRFEEENVEQVDKSHRPFYLLLCLQRWLNIVLNLLIASIAVGVIALAVNLKGTTTGAQIGVALNLILVANASLLRLVETYTTLEVSLGAVARLKSAVQGTPREDKPCEDLEPPENWPSAGAIELENITVSYNSQSIALRNISLNINAGQKLVICGRTGSGKSTLLLTLLHLLNPTSGTIKIDELDISRIPRSILRQRAFITVPQDPFIFASASLRFNLDPYSQLSSTQLVSALEKTQLWTHISRGTMGEEAEDILGQPISALPPLSTGQMQLLSLARAVLRRQAPFGTRFQDQEVGKSKAILLLDEATSSLDPETEKVVQEVIREEFTANGHTVLVVAHRVGALVGQGAMREGVDGVLWMKDGRVGRAGGAEMINEGLVRDE